MEGIAQEVKRHSYRSGAGRSWPLDRYPIFLAFLFLPSALLSQSYDVMIVEKTNHLVAYDSFQQSLDSESRIPLRSFAQMKILNARDRLSDGFTTCMKVDVDGEEFYLLTDNVGRLSGRGSLGFVRSFQKRVFDIDTVEILAAGRLTLRDPGERTQHRLSAGDRCIRYFSDAGRVYVKRVGNAESYGWASFPSEQERKWWKVVHPRLAQNILSPNVVSRIAARIREANNALLQIYFQLGKESGNRSQPPRWYVRSNATSLQCVLQPPAAAVSYNHSIKALAATFETYLLGTGYSVHAAGNRIEVTGR